MFSGLKDKAKSLIARVVREANNEATVREITKDNLANQADSIPLERDKHYIQVRLKSMRIVDSRVGWKSYYGCVNTYTSVASIGDADAEFQTVTTPEKLAGPDPANASRILTKDIEVLGPVPYRGGDVTIQIGLFAVQSSDLAKPFLDLLGTLSQAAGVSFVSAAMPFIGPLKTGAEQLLGMAKQSTFLTGLISGYSSARTGCYLVSAAPKELVDMKKIKFDENFRIDFQPNDKLADYPYLVFSIEADQRRADWSSIPDVKDTYESWRTVMNSKQLKRSDADDAYAVFRRTALTSPDLIEADAQQLVDTVNRQMANILGDTKAVTKAAGAKIGPFESLRLYSRRPARRT